MKVCTADGSLCVCVTWCDVSSVGWLVVARVALRAGQGGPWSAADALQKDSDRKTGASN